MEIFVNQFWLNDSIDFILLGVEFYFHLFWCKAIMKAKALSFDKIPVDSAITIVYRSDPDGKTSVER